MAKVGKRYLPNWENTIYRILP